MAVEYTPSGQYVAGEWRESAGEESIPVTNPTTEETLAEVTSATEADVAAAIEAAEDARYDWGRRPAQERGQLVREVGESLLDHREELAELVVAEQGKPISDARGEIDGAADMAQYMAEWDRRIEGDILPGESPEESIHLQRQPVGVVAAIAPWNYPVAVFMRKFAPALVAGNTVVAKPSEETPLATLRAAEVIDEDVDLPPGVFNLVTGGGSVGAQLVSSPTVDMVSMTGNVETGKQIMADAAANLTKVSLELGGKAPAIVWKDADVDQAVADILTARTTNTGQVCTCAERVYVHADVRAAFEEKYVDAAEGVEYGDPLTDPDMGPQVSAAELDKTERAVESARDSGATVLTGGRRPAGEAYERGYWYEPTVLTGVEQGDDVIQQEVFGPVTPIVEIDSLDQAIEYANDSRYGLSSYVYTDDYRTAMRAAEDLEFGETYINRSLGEAWHGHHIGWKESGLGGEDGKYGFLKYTQIKTVYHDYS